MRDSNHPHVVTSGRNLLALASALLPVLVALAACTASEEADGDTSDDAAGVDTGDAGTDLSFDLGGDAAPDWGPDRATDITVDPARCVDRDAWAVLVYEGIHRAGPLRLERYWVAAPFGGEAVADEAAASALADEGWAGSTYSGYLSGEHDVTRFGDFWFVWSYPADFGAAAFIDARNGTTPFSGTVVWSGSGGILAPRAWLGYAAELPYAADPTDAPTDEVRIPNSHWDDYLDPTDRLGEALERARYTEIAYGFSACGPYRAVLWAYTPSVGMTDAERARAVVLLSGRTVSDWLPADGAGALGGDCRHDYDCDLSACSPVSSGDGVCAAECDDDACDVGFTCVGAGEGEVSGACQPDDFCIDHDGDGAGAGLGCPEDCDDGDPSAFPGGAERDAACTDGVDNDCDGDFDCADVGCATALPCRFEICGGGFDDDGDGDVDCADADCRFDAACEPRACASDDDRSFLADRDPVALANRDILACDQRSDWPDPTDCVTNTFVINGASERCGRCFADLAGCGLSECADDCRSLGEACVDCQRERCWEGFEGCLGESW